MNNINNPRKNSEGYYDLTAFEAIQNLEREEEERFHKLLHTLFYLCDLAGFEVQERIVLLDKKTKKVWK